MPLNAIMRDRVRATLALDDLAVVLGALMEGKSVEPKAGSQVAP
jgi:hypothetical protein